MTTSIHKRAAAASRAEKEAALTRPRAFGLWLCLLFLYLLLLPATA